MPNTHSHERGDLERVRRCVDHGIPVPLDVAARLIDRGVAMDMLTQHMERRGAPKEII